MKKKMLKLTSLIAAFAITMVSLPASVGAMSSYDVNLIRNPGFDNDADIWENGTKDCPFTVTTVDGNKVALSENRTSNIDGPKQKITLQANKTYKVSVKIKPVSDTDAARGKLVVKITDTWSISTENVTCSAGNWTTVSGTVDTSELTSETDVYVYFQSTTNKDTTNNSYTGNSAFYLDDFEVKEYITTPEVAVDGNLISNAGFEKGKIEGFTASSATCTVVNDEFKANTGNYAVLSTDRSQAYGGPHTSQITLESNTYYYASAMVMAKTATTVKAKMRLQQGSGMNAITVPNSEVSISNTEYTKVANVFYNESASTGKVYVTTNERDLSESNTGVELYTDDYVLLPITSSVKNGATDVEPNSNIILTVPEDIEVTMETLKITNGAEIKSVEGNGREYVVSFSGMDYGTTYTLTLDAKLNEKGKPAYTFTTAAKPADYETSFSRSGTTINCSFTNNVNDDKIMLAVAGYSDSGQLKYIEIDVSETTNETLTVTAPADGVCYTVKVLLWNMKTLAPVCGALPLSEIAEAE